METSLQQRQAERPQRTDVGIRQAEDQTTAALQRALDRDAEQAPQGTDARKSLSPLARANPLVPLGMVALTLVLALLSVAFTLQS